MYLRHIKPAILNSTHDMFLRNMKNSARRSPVTIHVRLQFRPPWLVSSPATTHEMFLRNMKNSIRAAPTGHYTITCNSKLYSPFAIRTHSFSFALISVQNINSSYALRNSPKAWLSPAFFAASIPFSYHAIAASFSPDLSNSLAR